MTEEELHAYGEAALNKIKKKLHDSKDFVIQPIPLDPSSIPSEPLVDITLVNDWKFREGQWCRRCLIVAGDRPQHLRSHQ